MKITYWKDGGFYVGHLNDFPDYDTQGTTLDELKQNLIDLYSDLKSDEVPYIKHEDEVLV